MLQEELTGLRWYQDRVAACLLGGAVGDALGYPIEFDSLNTIRRRFGEDGIAGFVPYGDRSGLISDDTQMTLFTCEGLITTAVASDDASADSTPHVYRSYLRWLKTQNRSESPAAAPSWLSRQAWLYSARAPGNACTSGLTFGSMGTWDKPKNPDSKGCGTVMRAAPFGLQPGKDPARIFKETMDASVLTHGHPSGYLAAAAFAIIIRTLIGRESLQAAIDLVLHGLLTSPGHEEVTEALTAARKAAASGPPSPETVESLGGGWTAEEALAIAVYAALAYPSPGQCRDALLLAVNHSGDSDSTGSVCGNIMGAWHGRDALPADLVAAVEGRETIEAIAADLAMVTWPRWRRYAPPDYVSQITARYPAG